MTGLCGSMVTAIRQIAVRLLPPIASDAIRGARQRLRGKDEAEWEFRPDGWPMSVAMTDGWNHESVAQTQERGWGSLLERARAPHIVSGDPTPGEPPSASGYALHNTIMTFAYVLGRAAEGRTRVSILDWGCGMGQYAVLARALFPALHIDFHCRELPLLVDSARKALPGDTFHTEDATALKQRYDLVIASGSLQYFRDWRACLQGLAGATDRFMLVTRLPILSVAGSYVAVQRPYRRGYQTAYPGWFLQRDELLASVDHLGLKLDREFLVQEHAFVPRAPEQPQFRGFLFAVAAPG